MVVWTDPSAFEYLENAAIETSELLTYQHASSSIKTQDGLPGPSQLKDDYFHG